MVFVSDDERAADVDAMPVDYFASCPHDWLSAKPAVIIRLSGNACAGRPNFVLAARTDAT